jgi:hypothetical protein
VIYEIIRRGIKIQAIICDGRKGLFQMFDLIPKQYCNFHQVKTIRTYLTKNPKMPASKELWEITRLLTKSNRTDFTTKLEEWFLRWSTFLSEQNVDENGKKRYIHKNLRAAYRSLKTNLPWLFTWEDYSGFNTPNTTNSIDGQFSNLKNKLRNHNGLTMERKKKFIDEFFRHKNVK